MKKGQILSGLFALVFALSLATPAFAQDVFNYEEAYEWAVSVGYPEEYLELISGDPAVLQKIYLELRDVDELEVAASCETLTVNEPALQRGNISSSDLNFWMVAAKASIDGYISFVHINVAYEWLTTPLHFLDDAVAVNWDASLWYYDQGTSGFVADMRGGGIGGSAYETIYNPAQAVQGGIGWYCDLNMAFSDLYGNASFKLYPRDSQLLNGTRYATTISANYAHSTYSEESFTIGTDGVSVSFSGARDEVATTETVTYGV